MDGGSVAERTQQREIQKEESSGPDDGLDMEGMGGEGVASPVAARNMSRRGLQQ